MNEDLNNSYRQTLIDSILTLVYPHITEEMKKIKSEELKDKSIGKLEDLKRFLIEERKEEIINSEPENLYQEDIIRAFLEKQRNILIDSCLSLVFPNLNDIQKPIFRKQFENKSIEELEDIERFYLQELKEGRDPKV